MCCGGVRLCAAEGLGYDCGGVRLRTAEGLSYALRRG